MGLLKNIFATIIFLSLVFGVSSDTIYLKNPGNIFELKTIKIKGSIDSLNFSGEVISFDLFKDSGFSIIDSLYLMGILDTLFIYGRIDSINDTTGYTLINKDHSFYQKYGDIAIDVITFYNSIGITNIDSLDPEVRRLTAKMVLNKKIKNHVNRSSLSDEEIEYLGQEFLADLEERINTLPKILFEKAFEKALGNIIKQ